MGIIYPQWSFSAVHYTKKVNLTAKACVVSPLSQGDKKNREGAGDLNGFHLLIYGEQHESKISKQVEVNK